MRTKPSFTEYFTLSNDCQSTNADYMAYDYDKLYGETHEALGQPTAIFVDFFDQLEQQEAHVLDVGCGQGRDALFIARKGHRVVGVDISPNGIRDLKNAAEKESLAVNGVVADIATYTPGGMFDVVLVDRTLHMLEPPTRLRVLETLLDHVKDGGWILIADEASNIKAFETAIATHGLKWNTTLSQRGYLFMQRS